MNQPKYKAYLRDKKELLQPNTITEMLNFGVYAVGQMKLSDPIFLLSYGKKDINDIEIFQGDIIRLKNELGQTIVVICEFGDVERDILASSTRSIESYNNVLLTGFSFRNTHFNTFPITCNYKGESDVKSFEIIGNVFENLELVPWYEERFKQIYNI